MIPLTPEQTKVRERTLRSAFLLSLWAPLATGAAVFLSQSSTQLADFIRRTVDLGALTTSWLVFRHLMRHPELPPARSRLLEQRAGLAVALALVLSGLMMLIYLLLQRGDTLPGGNVYPGMAIAVMGLGVNGWFWRRYYILVREHYSLLLDAQRRLYRAKAAVDLSVLLALSSVAFLPDHPWTSGTDQIGSVVVALYLLWSGAETFRRNR